MGNIVFDMDGVLFATECLSDRLWEELTEEYQMAHMKTALRACRGRNRTDTRAYFAAHYPDFDYVRFEALKRERMMAVLDKEGMPIKTGAVELLTALNEAGWQVALATSTSRDSTMHHLKLAGFTGYFHKIITGDQIIHGKPHPEIYQTACAQLGVAPETAYAVEDSENGIKSAHAAGMQVIMVPDLMQPDAALKALTVAVQDSLLAVKNMLLS